MSVDVNVVSWYQYKELLKDVNGINNEEDWYENTSYWSSKGEEEEKLDKEEEVEETVEKSNFIRWGRANNLKETTLEELLNEDVNTIDIACLLSTHDIEELKIPLRQKYAITNAIHNLNNSPESGMQTLKQLHKTKTYSLIERETQPKPSANTKLSKSRSERITKVEKMTLWKRWKKPAFPECSVLDET